MKARQSRLYCAHFTFREFDVCWEGGAASESRPGRGGRVIELGEGFTLAFEDKAVLSDTETSGVWTGPRIKTAPGDF